jgi:Acetyltransferases, including N-acetylases of ribosomal proteins
MFGPVLEGERVRLAPVTEEMLPTFIGWFADTDVTRYLGRVLPPSLPEEKDWFAGMCRSDRDVLWAVLAGEKLIGITGIHAIDWKNRHAATGNLIGEKSEWGKGYGSEVVRLRTRFAFEQLGLEKLMTEVFAENTASIRALEKAGYRPCGVRRRHAYRHGRWHDMWLAEVLRDEWERENAG